MKLRALESIRYNDGKGTVKSMTHSIFNASGSLLKTLEYNYTYGDPAKGEIPDTFYKYEVGTAIDYTFSYDYLGRLTDKNLKTSNINKTESYTYKVSDRGTNWTTPLVWKMTDFAGVLHEYEYDKNGNITSDTYGGHTVSYKYDSLNRMTRYNDPVYGWTCVYVYDNRGNITEMQEYEYTTAETLGEPLYTYEYEYGNSTWADLLTSYYGADITYDELGNPTNWIWGETLEWENGRQLVSYDGSVNYTYNADGLRTGKSGDKNTEYYIVNGTYLGETTNINGTTYNLSYFYDENGSIAGLWLGEGVYYFAKNIQGDVTAILDYQGNVVANYRYDAYGYIISVTDANGNYISSATHIANLNPFRYRGYMYDEESGFYYLRSRYYDPYIGRFINADSTGLVTANPTSAKYDKNLFAYCDNNPVSRADDGGKFWNFVIGAAVGAVVGGVVSAISSYKDTGKVDVFKTIIGVAAGAASGLVAASGLGLFAQAGISAGIAGASNLAEQTYEIAKSEELTVRDFDIVENNWEALNGGVQSIVGSELGDVIGGGIKASGQALIQKGTLKIASGTARKAAGRSSSSLFRQGNKYISAGLKKVNIAKGISSVIGSITSGTMEIIDMHRFR